MTVGFGLVEPAQGDMVSFGVRLGKSICLPIDFHMSSHLSRFQKGKTYIILVDIALVLDQNTYERYVVGHTKHVTMQAHLHTALTDTSTTQKTPTLM